MKAKTIEKVTRIIQVEFTEEEAREYVETLTHLINDHLIEDSDTSVLLEHVERGAVLDTLYQELTTILNCW